MDTFFYIFATAMLAGMFGSLVAIQKSLSKIEKHLESRTQKQQSQQ